MKSNSKGQVTIPAELRRCHGFIEGDEVEVVADDVTLRIVHARPEATRGERIIERMRGHATSSARTIDLASQQR
ncbi:MAG: AbrB/MazE/SpoVT family DNA-binding domain-containing protein [Actinobacteria bacterium]|nr:AbrB/MazE/SpoVT family DNA-binding domain-containing protein [Actinomycetota bacterium]